MTFWRVGEIFQLYFWLMNDETTCSRSNPVFTSLSCCWHIVATSPSNRFTLMSQSLFAGKNVHRAPWKFQVGMFVLKGDYEISFDNCWLSSSAGDRKIISEIIWTDKNWHGLLVSIGLKLCLQFYGCLIALKHNVYKLLSPKHQRVTINVIYLNERFM